MHRRDDGLGQAHELQHQVAARPEESRDIAGGGVSPVLEVMAGAEGLSGARDDHHPHRDPAGVGAEERALGASRGPQRPGSLFTPPIERHWRRLHHIGGTRSVTVVAGHPIAALHS